MNEVELGRLAGLGVWDWSEVECGFERKLFVGGWLMMS